MTPGVTPAGNGPGRATKRLMVIAKAITDSEAGGSEIRQIYAAEDFGETLTPELRALEERLRALVASR